MRVWVDAQLSPALARWMVETLGVDATALRDLGLRDANDATIFRAARDGSAVVLTKDADFVSLVERHGPPPQIV
jgi:predicted nuclease of predicted toxin-antitoxin system